MQDDRRLTRNLSPLGAWAFSIGTSIGWGSLVVTSNTYLAQAGPLGSTVGMIAGGLIMLVIAANYAYLMNVYPDAGGAYHYASEILGHDYGFLTAWYLSLTYLAILWANATSIPLFARYFLATCSRWEGCTRCSATTCTSARRCCPSPRCCWWRCSAPGERARWRS